MMQTDIPAPATEPFNAGRSTFLLFDFGVMLSSYRLLRINGCRFWSRYRLDLRILARLGYEVCAIDVDEGMPASIRSRALADRRLNPKALQPLEAVAWICPFLMVSFHIYAVSIHFII
jgi:hypothetical protein